MELRHLRSFVAVAEELNVHKAATRLHLSQPPLSRQIHDLEDEVGTKLFVRSQSGMHLTEAGRTFLKEARLILAQSKRAVQLAQAASRGEAGHLDIAYAVEGFEPVLLRVIRLFRRLFPMVELGIREMQLPPTSSGINPSAHRYRYVVDFGQIKSLLYFLPQTWVRTLDFG